MSVWYDVKLCPPPENEKVLVVCLNAKGAQYINFGYFCNGTFYGIGMYTRATHWMKLPKLPEVKR